MARKKIGKKIGKKMGKKMGKKIKKSFKNFGKSSILKSSASLYFVLLISIGLVLMYLSKKDYNSLMVLIAMGLLTNYFTKNMTITLGVAIIVSLIVRMKITQQEGFKEASKEASEKEIETGLKGGGGKKAGNTEGVKKMLKDKKNLNCFEMNDDSWEERAKKKGNCPVDQNEEGEEPKWCESADMGGCPKKQGFSKRLIPSSQPAKVGDDDDEDEVDTERIDYAKTLEQAYDNLQGMLGKEGISGLTSETSKLVEQQAGLMDSLKGMGPMLKEAKAMMSGMKDMGGMDTMKDMKAIINSVGGKKL